MRIAVNGQQAFGKAVLEALLERGEDIIAVYCEADKPGSKPDPLKEAALEHGLPLHQVASFKQAEVWETFRALKPDLCVMAYVTLFVPEEFLNVPTQGTIQYHPSLLPLHRGPSSINWPIIQGKSKTGLSIFWPDNGLDTGPILLQKEVDIAADDTLGSLYFDKLYPLGIEAMLAGVDLVRDGKAAKIPQDEAKASYESWCRKENVQIDWGKPVQDVYNLIRGANPQPGAWTTFAGKTVQLYECAKVENSEGQPGEVTGITKEGFTVATHDGQILIKRVRPEGGQKISAAEFATQAALTTGARFEG